MRVSQFGSLAMVAAICLSVPASVMAGPDEDPDTLRLESSSGETLASFRYSDVVREFPIREITTRTPWTAEADPIPYRGPDLKEILTKAGLGEAKKIRVLAYDHFQAVLEMGEIDQYQPIVAVERGCTPKDRQEGSCSADQAYKQLSLDDTGPFAIIWPMDELPHSFTMGRNFIWVWFVTALKQEP